jgi:hypothetical protein
MRGVAGLEAPSEEPPPEVTSEIVWRLAVRLYRDHRRASSDQSPEPCARCGQPWPCSGRRLAELGLNQAIVGPDR